MPLDAVGIASDEFGGLGDVPYPRLHRFIAEYRFVFSPIRYTSLPLAVVEAMTIGMPVVALATTELPTVIDDGRNGYVSCDPDVLVERMRGLLRDREEARRLGDAARDTARAASAWSGSRVTGTPRSPGCLTSGRRRCPP